MKKEAVLVFLMLFLLSGCMKLEGTGMASITGNVVHDLEAPVQEHVAPQQAKPTNAEAIETILEEEAPCQDECAPEGSSCTGNMQVTCKDIDFDGCLEFQEVKCIHGCDQNQCRVQRAAAKPAPATQTEVDQEQEDILTEENCKGKIVGLVQWNPHGSLCRRDVDATTTRGLVRPVHCCSKFHYQSKCTKNLGILKRGLSTSSQFFAIGCYD